MRSLSALLLAVLIALAGCTDPDVGGNETVEGTESEEDADETREVRAGGDPEDDSTYSKTLVVPESADWLGEHHFRIPFTLSTSAEVGEVYRLTIDIGTALQDAGLRWIGPAVPLSDFEADPDSALLHQVKGSGRLQSTVPVDARQAEPHSLELDFRHVGGLYYLYFDTVEKKIAGGETTSFDDGVVQDTTAKRAHPQWQGKDLWGVTAVSGVVKHWPGDTVNLYATVQNDGRTKDRHVEPLTYDLEVHAPGDWEDVQVTPSGEDTINNERRVMVKGITPETASGSDTVVLDVNVGNDTVPVTFIVRYHES